MKWLFRIIGFILLSFIVLCVIGFFLPAQQKVDASVILDVDRDEVYDVIGDLRSYPEWSGFAGPNSEWVFGGAEVGTGQTAAWQSGTAFGSMEIMQTAPGEFVLLQTLGPQGEQRVSLAIDETETSTIVLIESQRELGGFPYFSRVAAIRQKMTSQSDLNQATAGLSAMMDSSD